MTVLTTQAAIHACESSKDLLETLKHFSGEAPTRFSSLAVGKSRCIQALMAAGDRAAHAGVKKGEKADPNKAPKVDPHAAEAQTETAAQEQPAPAAKKVAAKKAAAKTPAKKTASPFTAMAENLTKPAIEAEKAAANLEAYMASKVFCPHCGTDSEADITAAGAEGTVAGDERNFCHKCGTEFWRENGKKFERRKPGRDVSSAVAESWTDEQVRAARSTKNNVTVDGVTYKSVREAFKALHLPLVKHVKFRGELKRSKDQKLAYQHNGKAYKFEVIARAAD